MKRRSLLIGGGAALAAATTLSRTGNAVGNAVADDAVLGIDTTATADFPHYWEVCVGSDHAKVAMRADWQDQLRTTHALAGFRSVRFHGIFDDDMGVCMRVDASGPQFSFLYVDQVLDAILAIGVRPFVELSFMPTALASSDNTIFWYNGNTSPPRRISDWTALLDAFARHLIGRYGIAEVATWRFECWNEPNLNFWASTQAAYFDFYLASAQALKQVDQRLQVGGPATARFEWVQEFLQYCEARKAPLDFVSGHIYADDPQELIFGSANKYPLEQVMPRTLALKRQQIDATAFRNLPIVVSEWASQNPAFVAQMIKDCAGMADTMSFWTFDNVFEERGPIQSFDNPLYGLLAQGGVPRPTMHVFTLLHRLGDRLLSTPAGPLLATRRADGSLAVLVWNLIPAPTWTTASGNPAAMPTAERLDGGLPRRIRLGLPGTNHAAVTTISPTIGSFEHAYTAMDRPASPTPAQYRTLLAAATLPAPASQPTSAGVLELTLPANAVALIEVVPI